MATSFHASTTRTMNSRTISLASLGAIWAGLLIFMGIIFRTYDIAMPTGEQEFLRQIGSPVLIVEIATILFACANGLDFARLWRRQHGLVRALLVIFLATFSVSSVLASKSPPFSMMLNLGTIIQILFALALSHSLAVVDRSGLSAMRTNMAIGLAIFGVMIVQIFVFTTPPHAMATWQFAIPGFISVRLFGAVCGAVFTFFTLQLFADEEVHLARPWHYAALTLVAGLMIWTGTRVAILGCACAIAAAVCLYRIRPRLRVVVKVVACLLVAAIAATRLLPADPVFALYDPADYVSGDSAMSGRLELWAATWHAFLTVPLFGAGAGSNSWMMPAGIFHHVQPHNAVLQFLLNWGAIAAVSALSLLAIATWRAHQITVRNRALLPILAMLYCLLVMAFFDGILHFARETMMVMMCFGIIFRAGREDTAVIPL